MTGRVAAGLDDAAPLMRGLASQRELAGVGAVERRAELEQLLDARRCVARENLDDLRVADAGAGALRVDCVQARRIVLADRGGDAALRPIRRRAFAQPRLAEHGDACGLKLERRDQAGDAGADDQRVAAHAFPSARGF